jgi:hypothetical protein
MKWEPDDAYWSDRAGAWFAGYVFGLLSACAFAIASGGCWSGTAHCPEPGPTYTLRQGTAPKPCVDGLKVPERPDFSTCEGDEEEFWYCRSVKLDFYADALNGWILSATARCAP